MVYVFLAEGFEETEAITPIDLLRRAGADVVTVGVMGKTVKGSHGIPVISDITIDEVEPENAELAVLPGGGIGTKNLAASSEVAEILRYCYDNNKLIGAICAAPSVLGQLGFLKGRKAVCYPGFEEKLTGAQVLDVPAVTDGNIITARGAGAALEFSYELIKALGKDADKIADAIIHKR